MDSKHLIAKLTSRKFLTVLVVQIASVCAIFAPDLEHQIADAGMRIIGLIVLVAAALGYGKIEGGVDAARVKAEAGPEKVYMMDLGPDADADDDAETDD